jgi:hypothetical protein
LIDQVLSIILLFATGLLGGISTQVKNIVGRFSKDLEVRLALRAAIKFLNFDYNDPKYFSALTKATNMSANQALDARMPALISICMNGTRVLLFNGLNHTEASQRLESFALFLQSDAKINSEELFHGIHS